MELRNESKQSIESRHDVKKKPRFQIIKLEERIAPAKGGNGTNNCGGGGVGGGGGGHTHHGPTGCCG
jgi:hypothetical protein